MSDQRFLFVLLTIDGFPIMFPPLNSMPVLVSNDQSAGLPIERTVFRLHLPPIRSLDPTLLVCFGRDIKAVGPSMCKISNAGKWKQPVVDSLSLETENSDENKSLLC